MAYAENITPKQDVEIKLTLTPDEVEVFRGIHLDHSNVPAEMHLKFANRERRDCVEQVFTALRLALTRPRI